MLLLAYCYIKNRNKSELEGGSPWLGNRLHLPCPFIRIDCIYRSPYDLPSYRRRYFHSFSPSTVCSKSRGFTRLLPVPRKTPSTDHRSIFRPRRTTKGLLPIGFPSKRISWRTQRRESITRRGGLYFHQHLHICLILVPLPLPSARAPSHCATIGTGP